MSGSMTRQQKDMVVIAVVLGIFAIVALAIGTMPHSSVGEPTEEWDTRRGKECRHAYELKIEVPFWCNRHLPATLYVSPCWENGDLVTCPR